MNSILRFEKVSKIYTRRRFKRSLIQSIVKPKDVLAAIVALEETSLSVEKGSCVHIAGPNGAGKSTLLALAADVLSPTSGTIERRGSAVPMLVPSAFMLLQLPLITNIRTAWCFLQPDPSCAIPLESILDLAGLADNVDHPVYTLSKGMLHRITLSIGLHVAADLYLIDELFDPLDTAYRFKLMTLMEERIKNGSSVLITSHTMESLGCSRAYRTFTLR